MAHRYNCRACNSRWGRLAKVYQFIIGLDRAVIQDLSEINLQLADFDVTAPTSKMIKLHSSCSVINLSSDYCNNVKHNMLDLIFDLIANAKL